MLDNLIIRSKLKKWQLWSAYVICDHIILIPNNRLGLYITRNAFSWKMIIWKVWALILNFTTMKHGGARGGAGSFWWLVNLSDSTEFWKIPTFLRLWEGRWWRGAWRGAKMEGRVEGRVLAYMARRHRWAPKFSRNSKNQWFLELRSWWPLTKPTWDISMFFLMTGRYNVKIKVIRWYNMGGRMAGRHVNIQSWHTPIFIWKLTYRH